MVGDWYREKKITKGFDVIVIDQILPPDGPRQVIIRYGEQKPYLKSQD